MAAFPGGAVSVGGAATVTNCVFTQDSAVDAGGALDWDRDALTVTNCTFTQNGVTDSGSGAYGGGAVSLRGTGGASLTNCILWNDTGNGATLQPRFPGPPRP